MPKTDQDKLLCFIKQKSLCRPPDQIFFDQVTQYFSIEVRGFFVSHSKHQRRRSTSAGGEGQSVGRAGLTVRPARVLQGHGRVRRW